MDTEAVDRLHLVHARLLYIISELFTQGRINDEQKLSLKCKLILVLNRLITLVGVFKDEVSVFDLYEEYKDDLDDLAD